MQKYGHLEMEVRFVSIIVSVVYHWCVSLGEKVNRMNFPLTAFFPVSHVFFFTKTFQNLSFLPISLNSALLYFKTRFFDDVSVGTRFFSDIISIASSEGGVNPSQHSAVSKSLWCYRMRLQLIAVLLKATDLMNATVVLMRLLWSFVIFYRAVKSCG